MPQFRKKPVVIEAEQFHASTKSNRSYDSTVARIAGNVAPALIATFSGDAYDATERADLARVAVALARDIVAEVKRTEPKSAVEGDEQERA